MLNIVYSSTATQEFSREELAELLARARAKNTQWGITGLLLYKRGVFMQALEGEEAAVRALYATIRADPRHHQIKTLVDIPVAQPRFSDWSMGFENIDDMQLDASGSQIQVDLPPKLEFPWRGSVAMQFLTAFWGPKEIPPATS
jgi:hypothetical protein